MVGNVQFTISYAGGASAQDVVLTVAASDHLVFLRQPTDTAAGQSITPAVMVEVVDEFGNVLTGDNTDTLTVAIGANPSVARHDHRLDGR